MKFTYYIFRFILILISFICGILLICEPIVTSGSPSELIQIPPIFSIMFHLSAGISCLHLSNRLSKERSKRILETSEHNTKGYLMKTNNVLYILAITIICFLSGTYLTIESLLTLGYLGDNLLIILLFLFIHLFGILACIYICRNKLKAISNKFKNQKDENCL